MLTKLCIVPLDRVLRKHWDLDTASDVFATDTVSALHTAYIHVGLVMLGWLELALH